MVLQYRHNNGYDSVLLADDDTDDAIVRSYWTVNRTTFKNFCDCSFDVDDWDNQYADEYRADEYGELVAIREAYTLRTVDDRKWSERVQFMTHKPRPIGNTRSKE